MEHVALVAVIAAVMLVAVAAVAAWSPTVSNAVTTAFGRGLCVVGGQRCQLLDRQPCPVLRTTETSRQGVAIGFVRLGHDRALSIERRSDGTYAMSLVEGLRAGAGLAAGREGENGSADVGASLALGGRAGRTYVASNAADAAALVERLRGQRLPALRSVAAGVADLAGLVRADPSVSEYVLAGDGALEAAANFGLGDLVSTSAKGSAHAELGVKVAAHAKELTAYLAADARVGVFFDALTGFSHPGRSRGAGSGGASPDSADGAVTGTLQNPLSVNQSAEAIAGGSVALRYGPGPVLLGVEVVAYAGTGSHQTELHARLDPSDPDVRGALHAWLSDPLSPSTLQAFGEAASDSAVLDRRRFETHSSREHEFSAQVADLIALGVSADGAMVTGRLVEQRTRPQGGVWEERLDCEPAAA